MLIIVIKSTIYTVPAGNYMFKVNNRKTSKKRHWCRSDVFIVNFEYISQLVLVLLL